MISTRIMPIRTSGRTEWLAPGQCDDLLWLLMQVCSLTLADICRETGISYPTLHRMRRGHNASNETRQLLKQLLERTRDEMAKYSDMGLLTNEFLDWRKATYSLINAALHEPTELRRPMRRRPTPKERATMYVMTQYLAKGPKTSQDVFRHFSSARVSRTIIYAAAAHLGVLHDYVGFGPDKLCYWRLPINVNPVTPVGGPP